MNDLTVRDHSQPCEHPLDPEGMYDGAFVCEVGGVEWWDCGQCPGGKEIKLPTYLLDPDWLWRAANGMGRAANGLHLDVKFCRQQANQLRAAAKLVGVDGDE